MSIKRQRRHRKRKKENTDTHSEYSFNVLILHSFWKWMPHQLITKYLVFLYFLDSQNNAQIQKAILLRV